jgi:hypothetical protein
MSSSVRSRLLTSALDYSVEATMTDFPGANVDAGKGPPVAAAYLRKFLQENLGRNLHLGRTTASGGDDDRVGHSCASSPGGMLIATLDGLNLSASDDVSAIAAALRSLMLARLDVRCRALTHHRTHVITRGRDTNLVTSGANSAWTQSGARRKRSEMPPPSVELKETLALDDTAFARRVAEAHRTWCVARCERLEAGGKGGAEDASGEDASTSNAVRIGVDSHRVRRRADDVEPIEPSFWAAGSVGAAVHVRPQVHGLAVRGRRAAVTMRASYLAYSACVGRR